MKTIVPPIKCQGIKTKLIPFIKNAINFNFDRWIEPFLGSGSVVFNIQPKNAILNDRNIHIINFYKQIQTNKINDKIAREFLEYHGNNLLNQGQEYYLKMRSDFNSNHEPLYFLFLNRSCFNGMIRFNKNEIFNVPFCKKDNRFSKAYITKICNQISAAQNIIQNNNWTFTNNNWDITFDNLSESDFVYLDPPYIGRNTTYFNEWTNEDAIKLADISHKTPAKVCLSMWESNQYRKNQHLYDYWQDFEWLIYEHFYHLGGKQENRHSINEILAIKRPSN